MKTIRALVLVTCCAAALCARAASSSGTIDLGRRLFFETRFSQFFFARSGGNPNAKLATGDPVMDTTSSIYGPLPGPFAGQSMNCRACHLVQEQQSFGFRAYSDFATRSPVPANGDGRTATPRNSIALVDSLRPHPTPLFLHFDGQFSTVQDLIITTLTGRNFGWKPTDYATAMAHIALIIRQDNGSGVLAQQHGALSYATVFAGAEAVPEQFRIEPAYRLSDVTLTNAADPSYVSNEQIVQGVAALIGVYLENLAFSRDTNGFFNGSPYDVFLIKNGLPRGPTTNETDIQYSRRLLQLIGALANPLFVADPADGHFQTHDQLFQFGSNELTGLKIFLGESKTGMAQGSTGNCLSCHPPPAFTDFLFHNTGATQEEYDSVHGPGSFMTLEIPQLSVRQTNYDAFLPPTPLHPNASGVFIAAPVFNQLAQVDLGLWNVFANPDFPAPQAALQQILPRLLSAPAPQIGLGRTSGPSLIFSGTNATPGWSYFVLATTNLMAPSVPWIVVATNSFDGQGRFGFSINPSTGAVFYKLSLGNPSTDSALPKMIALFKTSNLRDLGASDPYFHTGRMNTLENVISFYQNFSNRARAGAVRNAAPELSEISLDNSSLAPLAAFLRSLNEDYFDTTSP